MKKLLVVLMAAMMVLSMAAVSMAAAEVKGDFRYELYNTSADDNTYDNADLRVIVGGNISDTVSAKMQLRAQSLNYNQTDGVYGDPAYTKIGGNKSKFDVYVDEWTFTMKQSFGTFTLGNWDWKVTPSRVLLKSAGFNIFPRSEGNLAFDAPIGENFYVGAVMACDGDNEAKVNDNGYDLKVGYKNDLFGVETHYFDTKLVSKGVDLTNVALDVWYKPTSNIKTYVYGNDYEPGYAGIDGFDPVVGVQFTQGKFKASLEYALEARQGTANAIVEEWNEYALQLVYSFSNKITMELEYTNLFDKDVKADVAKGVALHTGSGEENKLVLRSKFAF